MRSLVCAKEFSKKYPPHGAALPKHLEVKLSRDAAHFPLNSISTR